MTNDIGEIEVERDQDPLLGTGQGEDIVVGSTTQPLIARHINVVAEFPKHWDHGIWDILIELESRHYAVIGTIRSRASSAA